METIRTVFLNSWVPLEASVSDLTDLCNGACGLSSNTRVNAPPMRIKMKAAAIPTILLLGHGWCGQSTDSSWRFSLPDKRPFRSSSILSPRADVLAEDITYVVEGNVRRSLLLQYHDVITD
jgi:hypothetical protein